MYVLLQELIISYSAGHGNIFLTMGEYETNSDKKDEIGIRKYTFGSQFLVRYIHLKGKLVYKVSNTNLNTFILSSHLWWFDSNIPETLSLWGDLIKYL